MIYFNSDYLEGAHPSIMVRLAETNMVQTVGYGEDEYCEAAREKIKTACQAPEADVHFLVGGTQTNTTVIAAILRPWQGVISAVSGHINCHEAASVESSGHKILSLPGKDGKITAEQIEACAKAYEQSGEAEYLTEPKMVYLSFPTEMGTLYSKKELAAIHELCQKYGMYLFVDGARMGYGLASQENDLTLADFAALCDVFYIGGTKCGALFGEAVVITCDALKRRFKAYMKQNGAVLAKGWLLGLQFCALLENNAYFEAAKRAHAYAMRLKKAFAAKNIPFWVENSTNQQFVILSEEQEKRLAQKYYFEKQETTERGTVVRFCTSWATTQEEMDALCADIERL